MAKTKKARQKSKKGSKKSGERKKLTFDRPGFPQYNSTTNPELAGTTWVASWAFRPQFNEKVV